MSSNLSILIPLLAFCTVQGAIDSKCLDCICERESNGCNPVPCAMDAGSLSCGFFQIKADYYTDCGKPGKKPGDTDDTAWKRCAGDFICASQCVNNYMNRYAARCQANPDCEVYARVHNGGPNGCKESSTLGYWNAIQQCLGTIGNCPSNEYQCGTGCCPAGSDFCGQKVQTYCAAGSVCCPSGLKCCPTNTPTCVNGETQCRANLETKVKQDYVIDSTEAIQMNKL